MRSKKSLIILSVLMLSALFVLWQLALAEPPSKPGNPGLPGCLAEVAKLQAEIDELESQPPAPVPQTGQTICYDINGGEINCEGTGQDGEFQNGIQCPNPRFTDNLDGTVTDNCTGLTWLQDANCFELRTWSEALGDSNGLADGNCGLTDGSSAGDWYLPNVKQLQSLVHHGFHNPVIPNTTGTDKWTEGDPFFAVQSHLYWSSTTDSGKTSDALFVNIDRGGMSNADKDGSHYVWPVRGGN